MNGDSSHWRWLQHSDTRVMASEKHCKTSNFNTQRNRLYIRHYTATVSTAMSLILGTTHKVSVVTFSERLNYTATVSTAISLILGTTHKVSVVTFPERLNQHCESLMPHLTIIYKEQNVIKFQWHLTFMQGPKFYKS